MKKFLALIIITLILICTSGCNLPFVGETKTKKPSEITEADSVSEFNIYPENIKFEFKDKFQRAGYRQLNDSQKGVYILLDNAVFKMQTGYISLGDVSQHDINKAYLALRNDRPEYFWIPMSYSVRSHGYSNELCFAKSESDWLYTASERKKYESEILKTLTDFNLNLVGNESEFDRELEAHDFLTSLIEYDHSSVDNYEKNLSAWDIVGGICNGKAVCEGYSKSMQVFSYMLGLDCATVTGVAAEPHMWNVINIDQNWYHLDLTANDSDNKGYHFYFNVTTEYVLKSRTIDTSFDAVTDINSESRSNVFLPNCTATEQNYHVVNSLYIAKENQVQSTVVSIICDARRQGKNLVEFAVSPEMDFVFGSADALKVFKLEKCISLANSELGSKRIKKYSYGGIDGALGFMISW